MDGYVVSARKYRPKGFEEVVGQEHITTTLKNSIENEHLAQALLFCGPRGVGKTTCARIVARMINGLGDDEDPSHNIFELDAASNNSVDHIRNLTDQVRYPPQYGKYKVYIIDEVHMLSNAAFNAFLKTLEEPPSYAIFILATTEKHKVIPTILSRCQIYDFNRIEVNDIKGHLQKIAKQEGIKAEEDALYLISQKSDGALRDALSIFDLIVNFSTDNSITYQSTIDNLHILDYDYYFKITDHLLQQDHASALLIFDSILRKGFDGHNFIVGLSEHFRNLMVSKDAETLKLLEVADSIKERYKKQSETAGLSFLLSALSVANEADINYKTSKNQRLVVELGLIKIAHLPSLFNLESSIEGNGSPELKKKTEEIDSPSVDAHPEPEPEPEPELEPKPEPAPKSEAEIIEIPEENTANVLSDTDEHVHDVSIGSQEEPAIEEIQETEQNSASQPAAKPARSVSSSKGNGKLKSTARLPRIGDIADNLKKEEEKVSDDQVVSSPIPIVPDPANASEEIVLEKKEVKKALENIKESTKSDQEKNVLNCEFGIVEPSKIILRLTNPVMIDVLERFKTTLVGKLKKELRRKTLTLEGILIENESNGEKKLYTNREKFEYLAEKEPLLRDLSNRLGLDPDF